LQDNRLTKTTVNWNWPFRVETFF